MKKRYYLFALAFAGLTLTSCGGNGSIGLNYDDSDLDIDTEWTEYSVPITKVNFDDGEDNLVIERGATYEYSYTVEPKKAVKKSLTWESSNTDVVTVSQGVLTGVGAGKAIIYVSNNEKSLNTISLNVEVIVPVTDISFEQTTLLADLNKDYQLSVDYTPFDTTEKGVTWDVENEEIATISDAGLLTTKGVTGVTTVTANSAYINKTISLTIDVADRTIYPDQVVIEEYENKIEVGKNFTMKARSIVSGDSSVMPTHPEVKYYSSDSSILTVEEDTGIVHALDVGTTTIYASAQGQSGAVSSELKTVEVFEIKVVSISLEDITLSNRDGRTEVPVPMTYTTDEPGKEASIPNFKYTIGDPTVATVNDNGILYAVAPSGTTTLKVEDLRSGVSKTVNVYVGYEVDSFTISGSSEIDAGKTAQLSVTTTPSGVPAGLISYSSDNTSVATVSDSGLVSGVSEGSAVITVTVTGMNKTVTETHNVKVNLPEIPFASGMSYVVGDHNYYSGESKASSTGSWDHANQAKVVDEPIQGPSGTLLYERRAIVKFNAGDLWKLRTADSYLPVDGHADKYDIGTYNTSAATGAFSGSHPDMSVFVTEEGYKNVLVNTAGYYAIYHAQYTNDHPEGWFNVYVERHELSISDYAPQVQIGNKVTLEAHNWLGNSEDLTYQITEGNELITVVRNDYKFEITAGSVTGTAKIVFTDLYKSVEVVVTVSTEAPLPKTFDEGIPYLVGSADYHSGTATGSGSYWGTDASKALKFTESTSDIPSGVFKQYEATVTFSKNNEFKVVIGLADNQLYWNVNYEKDVKTAHCDTAFSQGQMHEQEFGDHNMVVDSEGTYTIYAKSYENYGGWGILVMPKQGVPPTPGLEYSYSVNGGEFVKMTAGEGTEVESESVSFAKGDVLTFKKDSAAYLVTPKDSGQQTKVYAIEGGVKFAEAYTGKLYLDTSTGALWAGQFTPGYYLAGIAGEWEPKLATPAPKVGPDDPAYVVENVVLEDGAEVKFLNFPEEGNEVVWYNVGYTEEETPKPKVSTNSEVAYSVVSSGEGYGNLKVINAGTYNIYYNPDSGWYSIEDQNYVPDVPATDGYYLVGTKSNWKFEGATKLDAGESGNLAQLIGYEASAHEEFRIHGYHDGHDTWYEIAGGIGSDNYVVGDSDKTLNIYLNSEGIVYINEPVTPGEDVTYTITNLSSWIQDAGCVIFAWVWSPSDGGSWKSLTINGSTATFTVDEELTGFLLVRCVAGTTTPNWDIHSGNESGRIYNKTGDIICSSGTHSYSCSSWNDYPG